jgi:hypothetical protein
VAAVANFVHADAIAAFEDTATGTDVVGDFVEVFAFLFLAEMFRELLPEGAGFAA